MPFLHWVQAEFQYRLRVLLVYITGQSGASLPDRQNLSPDLLLMSTEAHAADEWPVGRVISCCNQAQTVLALHVSTALTPAAVFVWQLEDRLTQAKRYVDRNCVQIPLVRARW